VTTTETTETTPDETAIPIQGPGAEALMELMKTNDSDRYTDSLLAGAQYIPTANGETFYSYWVPPDFDPSVNGFVVILGGHGTYASTSFAVWQHHIEARKYGFIGLQWWFGGGEATSDYLTPDAIYRAFAQALATHGVSGRRVLFEGFSRGAANAYAVTVLDHTSDTPYFLMTIANAGAAMPDYPPNKAIDQGAFGAMPFTGTHWVLYCGEGDEKPSQSGCIGMSNTKAWLEAKGATIDLFIQDPLGDHGGFNLVPGNADKAFDAYEALWTW
jgi:hypothetical protein